MSGSGLGRSGDGRFAPGNKHGRGHPFAGRAAKLRSRMLKQVTGDDLAAIIDALVEKAKHGDLAAAREVLDRVIGKACVIPPPTPKSVDGPDELERELARMFPEHFADDTNGNEKPSP